MQSQAQTVRDYLASLPPERRSAIEAVRKVILANLDAQYQEGMQYGMIGYYVPHSVYPPGYHCDPRLPLQFAALASQKNYMSLYLMGVYCGCDGGEPTEHAKWFQTAWKKSGKKLDMGKACIRFKSVDDLPLEVIGEAIRRLPARSYIKFYEAARAEQAKKASARAAKKAPKKKAARA